MQASALRERSSRWDCSPGSTVAEQEHRRLSAGHWLAHAAAHVCKPPCHAERAAEGGSGAARAQHDRDDDALCAPLPRRATRRGGEAGSPGQEHVDERQKPSDFAVRRHYIGTPPRGGGQVFGIITEIGWSRRESNDPDNLRTTGSDDEARGSDRARSRGVAVALGGSELSHDDPRCHIVRLSVEAALRALEVGDQELARAILAALHERLHASDDAVRDGGDVIDLAVRRGQ